MPHPSPRHTSWLLRVETILESVLIWCQEKGFWAWSRTLFGVGLVLLWICFLHHPASFAALVLGAALLAPLFVPLAAWPLHRFIDSIYLGSANHERPTLNYRMAERMLSQHRYDDAAQEFERIAYWHPKEARAYCDGIRAARAAGNDKLATRLYRRGLLRCPKTAQALRLARMAPTAGPPVFVKNTL